MVCELAQAGLEGGSPRLIRAHWGLADYGEMQDYWLAVAPPPHISISLIAGALGIDFDRLGPSEEMAQLEPDSGPSIAELAALAPPPVAGGDTMGASLAILQAISSKGDTPDAGQ